MTFLFFNKRNGLRPFPTLIFTGVILFIMNMFAPTAHADITSNLDAWWKLDDASGTTAADASGNGNNLTISYGKWSVGKIRGAANFNGANATAIVNATPVTATDNFTISAWVYWRGQSAYGSEILSNGLTSTTGYGLWIGDGNGGSGAKVTMHVGGVTWDALSSNYTMPANKWMLLTVVRDAGTWKLYVNGSLQVTGGSSAPNGAPSGSTSIGTRFDGILDDVRIYNRPLNAGEVAALYAVSDGLAGWWKLDEGSGSTAYDTSGNANDGTLNNSPSWATGPFGTAGLSFDGSNGKSVSKSSPSGLPTIQGNKTISYWMKINTYATDQSWIELINGTNSIQLGILSGQITAWEYGGVPLVTTSSVPAAQTWVHVCYTYDGTTHKLYINAGAPVTSTTAITQSGSPSTFYISTWDGTSQPIDGSVYDIRIYDRVLSSDEVTSIYQEVPPGPILHWKLDETTGALAADSSGYGFDGAVSAPVSWTTGKMKGALSLNGSNSISNASNPTAVIDGLTMSLWIYWRGSSDSTDLLYNGDGAIGGYGMLISNGSCGAGNKISLLVGQVNCDAFNAGYALPTNTWTHLAAVRDAGTWKLYVNGSLQETGETTTPITSATGGIYTGSPDAIMDDVRFYNRPLTAAQLQMVYEEGADGWWKLDEGAGTSAADSSGLGNTGTLTNGPTWVAGQIGAAADFDGSNDYMTASDADFPSGNETRTISLWAKIPASAQPDSDLGTFFEYGTRSNGQVVALYVYQGEFIVATYAYAVESNVSVNDNQWHYYAATFDGTTWKVYIDGVLKNSGAITTNTILGGSLNIGRALDNTFHLDGSVDDVHIYPRVLTADEISAQYQKGLTGLAAWWKFDEASGTSATDSSGNANTGTLTNGPTRTAGKLDKAVSFDGSNDYISIADSSALQFGTGDFSMSFWVYPRTVNYGVADQGTIISKDYTGFEAYIYEGSMALYVGGAANGLGCSTAVSTNSWYHYVFTRSGTTVSCYVNGVQDGSTTNGADASNAGTDVNIGIRTGDATKALDGMLDDIRLYQRALSAGEITQLYNEGATGLVGWWKLDEGSGTSAADSSGQGNTGTLTNSPSWVSGKIAGAVNFSQVSSHYISMGNPAVLNVEGNPFTVSAWVKVAGQPASGDAYYLVAKGQGGSGGWALVYFNEPGVGLGVNLSKQGVLDQTFVYSLPTGVWSHVAAVQSATQVEYFVNGQSIGTYSNAVAYNSAATKAFDIGAGNDITTNSMDGAIDDVRVYNRALSDQEIANIYHEAGSLSTGLVAHWKLDDGASTTAVDSSGNGNAGTLTNGPTWTTAGKVGKALALNRGNESYVLVADSSSINPTNAITISAWIYPTALSTEPNPGLTGIVSKYNSSTNSDDSYFLRVGNYPTNNTQLNFGFLDSGLSERNVFGNNVTLNAWQMVTATFDGSVMRVYQNGVQTATNNFSGSMNSGSSDLTIGLDYLYDLTNNLSNRGFTGKIDDVRIYGRALSAQEVRQLFLIKSKAQGWGAE